MQGYEKSLSRKESVNCEEKRPFIKYNSLGYGVIQFVTLVWHNQKKQQGLTKLCLESCSLAEAVTASSICLNKPL